MAVALELHHVLKQYKADKPAVDGVSFAVGEGSCFGLLGPNGAGKSTIMKMIAGIIPADQGEIKLFNDTMTPARFRVAHSIGYVPQEITLYESLSAVQNLNFFGKLYGLRGKQLQNRIQTVLEQVGLSDRASDKVGTYSGGMKRRINIAAALLHEPRLVVLDEPTVGIDPQSRNHIFELIRSMQRKGITVLYSTHYMEEVELLCDELAIVDHGKVIAQGALRDVLGQHVKSALYVEVDDWSVPEQLAGMTAVRAEGSGWLIESANPLKTLHELAGALLQSGKHVRALELQQPSLESIFIQLTGAELRD